MKLALSAFALAAVASAANAGFANLQITEIYAGLTGEDGTADWFELTNTGATAISTDGLVYDDENPSVASGGNLDVTTINPGESIVVVIGSGADAAEFANVWGAGFQVISTNSGGGGLSQGGDEVNVLLAIDGTILASQAFGDIEPFGFATADTLGGSPVASVVGVNGAFESNLFFNDNIGQGPDFLVSLIGSPGAIPTPGSAALLALAGLAGARRRR